MGRLIGYNPFEYTRKILEMSPMLLDRIVAPYTRCKPFFLNDAVSPYLYYVNEEPFYIAPEFHDVKTESASSTRDPKFILFSAPGAAGKSSLALYLSYKLGALYWNLARVRLGHNSFVGSIATAVGSEHLTDFFKSLNNSDVLLAIDAFDEAEIISGRLMLEAFISDISDILKEHTKAPVFLFARTDSAQFIASYCTDKKIPFVHYEIGFLGEAQAKEFIEKSVAEDGKLTSVYRDCISRYYAFIKSNITVDECRSFLGYPPVLEAISRHIRQAGSNPMLIINSLSKKADCASIILDIMEDLLSREQTDKAVPAFRQRASSSFPNFSDWDALYSKREQRVRLIHYILWKDTSYDNYPIEALPPQMVDEYQEFLDSFLPQHPFVRYQSAIDRLDFTGPAFRDYTLAKLLLGGYPAEADLYFDEFYNPQNGLYIPSQIFFDCYTNLTDGKVYVKDLARVFESYRAKATAMEHPYLQCSTITSDETPCAIAQIGIIENEDSSTSMDLILSEDDEIAFDNISNTALDLPDVRVRIGRSGTNARIHNSSLICKSLNLIADVVSIETYAPDGCLLVCFENVTGNPRKFEVIGDGSLKVSIPNLEHYYRLFPYDYDFQDPATVDITKFVHAMRSIMAEFRTHKKDTLSKDWEKIEHVTVGGNQLKREILDYLKSKGIIYLALSENQYKVDMSQMQRAQISRDALLQMRTSQLESAFQDFCAWRSSSSRV